MPAEWTYREVGTDFQPIGIDFGQPGGELYRPPGNGAIDFNLGNSPDALSDLMAEAMAKQQAVVEARNFVDSLYQQNPTLRDVPISVDSELLPAEDFDEFIQNQGLKSARPIDDLPPDLSDVYSGKPSTNNGFNRATSAADDVIDVAARPVAQSLDDVVRASGALPRAARLLGNPATQGLIDLGVGIVQGDSLPRAASGAIGSTSGGFAGAYIGGALGAGIGSIIPVVGTAAGAAIGSFVGGWIGGQIGGDAFRGAFDALFPNATEDQKKGLTPNPGVIPFYGGQSAGIKYNVTMHFEYDALASGQVVDKPNGGGTFYGPIGYPEIGSYIDSFNRDTWYIGFSRGIQNSTAIQLFIPWVGVKNQNSKPRLISFSVARTDGQPDTGGNLAAIPTTPIAPSSRALSNPNNDRFNNYYPAGEPRSRARGDGELFVPSGRLAPGTSSPVQSGSGQVPLFPSTPTKPKTPKAPENPAETPTTPKQNSSIPDRDYGWEHSLLIGDSDSIGIQPDPPVQSRPPGLPGFQKNLDGDTTTGLRPDPPTTRPPGTGLKDKEDEECECKTECDPCDLLEQIKNALLEEITLKLTYNSCNSEVPEEHTVTAPRIHAIAHTLELKDIYDDRRGHHACELSTAIPESWAWKVGEIPQLVVQFAEDVKPGKSSRWSVTIPHYRFDSNYQPNIPVYIRGNCMGTLILNDNSQLVVNCKNKLEWEKFLAKITPLIDPSYLENARTKTTDRGGQTIEQKRVKPVYGKFFSTGQKNLLPDWIIRF